MQQPQMQQHWSDQIGCSTRRLRRMRWSYGNLLCNETAESTIPYSMNEAQADVTESKCAPHGAMAVLCCSHQCSAGHDIQKMGATRQVASVKAIHPKQVCACLVALLITTCWLKGLMDPSLPDSSTPAPPSYHPGMTQAASSLLKICHNCEA